MKTRTASILLGTLLLLGVIALLADRAEEKKYSTRDSGKLLPKLDPAKANRLEVKAAGKISVVEKKEGAWKVEPEGFAADETAVKDALDKLAKIEKDTVASENPAKHEALELKEGDAKTLEARVWAEGSSDPVADLRVGKSGGDWQSNLVRLKGEDRVYQTRDLVRASLDRGERGWRDHTIFKTSTDEATRIEVTSTYHAVLERPDPKAGATWSLTDPAGAALKEGAADGILRNFADLQADGFAAASDPATTGLDAPESRVKVTLKDGKTLEMLFGKDAGTGKVYAKRADTDTVYELMTYRKSSMAPQPATLSDALAPPPPPPPSPSPSPSPSPAAAKKKK